MMCFSPISAVIGSVVVVVVVIVIVVVVVVLILILSYPGRRGYHLPELCRKTVNAD